MTDEEIEFALKQYATGGGRNVMNMDWAATLDYINRLKEACQSAIQSFTRMETLYKLKCNELENAKAENEKLRISDDSKLECTLEQHGEIHRLRDWLRKAREENEDMHGELMSLQAYIDNHEEVWKSNAEIDKAIVHKDTAKSAVRDFVTRLSYVRKSTVDDNSEPIVTVGVVNFDDMVDMFHELYGDDKNEN